MIVAAVAIQAEHLQNGNWRAPYFLLATEMEYAQDNSSSGMFWDGIGPVELFEESLWPDEQKLGKNHWFLEPSINAGFLSEPPDTQDNDFWQASLLNSIKYKSIYIRQTLNVDKRYDYDNCYPAHKDRAVRGRIEEAFLQVNWKYGFFRLGRMERNWGPFADRSLILSSNPYTYDALEWQLQSSLFEFRHLFAAFPQEKSYWDTNGKIMNRFFAAHALNLILGKWATVGVLESVVFSRDKGFPDFTYVNPFSIYTVINTNQEGVGNLMLGVQWKIHPFTENIALKGQIVWDDFQVDDSLVTDKEPTHWGMDMGLYWRNPFALKFKNSVKVEYNLRSKWLYTVPDYNTDMGEGYRYLAKSLGYEENDGYRVGAGFNLVGKKYWAGSLFSGYEEKGANSPVSRWNDSKAIPGLPNDTLSEPTETRIDCGLNLFFYFKDYADLRLTFNNVWIKNENNIKSEDFKYKPFVKVECSLHFSDFITKLPD